MYCLCSVSLLKGLSPPYRPGHQLDFAELPRVLREMDEGRAQGLCQVISYGRSEDQCMS